MLIAIINAPFPIRSKVLLVFVVAVVFGRRVAAVVLRSHRGRGRRVAAAPAPFGTHNGSGGSATSRLLHISQNRRILIVVGRQHSPPRGRHHRRRRRRRCHRRGSRRHRASRGRPRTSRCCHCITSSQVSSVFDVISALQSPEEDLPYQSSNFPIPPGRAGRRAPLVRPFADFSKLPKEKLMSSSAQLSNERRVRANEAEGSS